MSDPLKMARPLAWLCELMQEDGTVRTMIVQEDPDGLRFNDIGEPSPFKVTPLYAQSTHAADVSKSGAAIDAQAATVEAPLNGIKATEFYGEGAIAQCGTCGRYTMDPAALHGRFRLICDCGDMHGWSGSFKRPGPDAKWHGKSPAATPPAVQAPLTDQGAAALALLKRIRYHALRHSLPRDWLTAADEVLGTWEPVKLTHSEIAAAGIATPRLTDERIRDLWSWSATAEAERTANTQQHAFARAIEAAHGIGAAAQGDK